MAMHGYLRGRRIDVQAIAAELGLGRTTVYRWFGSRDELIGEVLVLAATPLLEQAREQAGGEGGPALLETLDRFNRYSIRLPSQLGTRGLRVRVYQYWSGPSSSAWRGI